MDDIDVVARDTVGIIIRLADKAKGLLSAKE